MSEVVIVGAGAAGIGAALELQAQGIECVILEASDRVGGRAYTDTTSLPAPWDQGCHWLHCANENPLVPWADKTGAQYRTTSTAEAEEFLWTSGVTHSGAEIAAYYRALSSASDALERAGKQGQDVPLTDVLPEIGAWMPNALCMFGLLAGDDAKYVSAQSYADYGDTGQDWPVRSGYGRILAQMADALSVQTDMPVLGVEQWADGARVETSQGMIEAQGVIVTASTNVLASGAIRFGPGPAADLLPLIADVPCGAYEKVAIAFKRMPSALAGKRHGMITLKGEMSLNFQIIDEAVPMVIVHMAGDLVRELRGQGDAALEAYVLDRFSHALGASVGEEITGVAVTDWLNNPWVRGSYSHAKPGTAPGRYKMIAADTGRVAFAGEAFSLRWQATAHGAYQSGRDAAARLAGHLGAGLVKSV